MEGAGFGGARVTFGGAATFGILRYRNLVQSDSGITEKKAFATRGRMIDGSVLTEVFFFASLHSNSYGFIFLLFPLYFSTVTLFIAAKIAPAEFLPRG